jgi:hypothetical protein
VQQETLLQIILRKYHPDPCVDSSVRQAMTTAEAMTDAVDGQQEQQYSAQLEQQQDGAQLEQQQPQPQQQQPVKRRYRRAELEEEEDKSKVVLVEDDE